jgi:hypothetical protein
MYEALGSISSTAGCVGGITVDFLEDIIMAL